MRQVVLDTETTGLDPGDDHRIIEIGCVEMVNRRTTGNDFHCYLQPDRQIDAGAVEVHGITNEMLADKPRFEEVAEELIDYLRDAELIIHNAPFDVGFLDHEFARSGRALRVGEICEITDSLVMARRRHPGQKNTLDALCKRYQVDASHRELHGALLDARLLADVFLAMTGGQTALALDTVHREDAATGGGTWCRPQHGALPVIAPTPEELQAHRKMLELVAEASGGNCLWQQLTGEPDPLEPH